MDRRVGARRQNSRFRFVNFGVGSDLSFNTVRRLSRLISTQPKQMIVLTGTNDIIASVFPNFLGIVRRWNGLPEGPTVRRFEEKLELITRRLRQETNARTTLSSPAPVGEDPHSVDPGYMTCTPPVTRRSGRPRRAGTDYIEFYDPFRITFQDHLSGSPRTLRDRQARLPGSPFRLSTATMSSES